MMDPNLTHSGLATLLGRAWPEGLGNKDRQDLARLSDKAAQRLERRLRAILDWTQPEHPDDRPATAAEAASRAEIGLTQFRKLVRQWKSSKSLHVLGVGAAPRKSRLSSQETAKREAVIKAALKIIRADPTLGSGTVRTQLSKQVVGLPSPPAQLRLIEEARRRLPPQVFGERLIIDSAGLDLIDPDGLRLRLHVVLDSGTLLALGWIVATDRSGTFGHINAVDDALGRLATFDLSGIAGSCTPPELDVRFAPWDDEGEKLFNKRFELAPVRHVADRIQGRAIVRALGERLARTWLGTGWRADGISYRTGRREHLPIYTFEQSQGMHEAIEAHNTARLSLVEKSASKAAEVPVDAIQQVSATLEKILPLEKTLLRLPSYEWAARLHQGLVD